MELGKQEIEREVKTIYPNGVEDFVIIRRFLSDSHSECLRPFALTLRLNSRKGTTFGFGMTSVGDLL